MQVSSERFGQIDVVFQIENEAEPVSGGDLSTRFHEMEHQRWYMPWKPAFETWEIHTPGLPEKLECKFEQGSFALWTRIQWPADLDVLQVLANLPETLGSDAVELGNLRRIITDLPKDSRAEVFRAMVRIAKRFRVKATSGQNTDDVVIDSFRGRVEKIEEGTAYVKFVDRKGGVSYAQVDAEDLLTRRIQEGSAFLCEIRRKNGETTMTLSPLEKNELTERDYAEIDRELDELLPDSLFESDKR